MLPGGGGRDWVSKAEGGVKPLTPPPLNLMYDGVGHGKMGGNQHVETQKNYNRTGTIPVHVQIKS